MSWQSQLKGDSVSWLLEKDDPGVRYLALRDLMDLPADDRELRAARKAAHQQGPIAAILAEMDEAGYWARARPGLQSQISLDGLVAHPARAVGRVGRRRQAHCAGLRVSAGS